MRDFGRALSVAISDSSEASRRLREIRDSGYSLYLLLDGVDASETVETEVALTRRTATADPEFRINGQDLSFLRSIGIDPTRRGRSRRG